jgi:hypothetical protein
MKKYALLLGVIIFVNATAWAQAFGEVVYGLKAGANYANHHVGSFGNRLDWKVGYYAGVLARVRLSKRFGLKSELLFAKQGAIFDRENITLTELNGATSMGSVRINVNELTFVVPVLIQTNLDDRLYFEAGPQFGFIAAINENVKVNTLSDSHFRGGKTSGYDQFDLGLAFGSGYFLSDKWEINARYFLGLVERDGYLRSSVINLGLAYQL